MDLMDLGDTGSGCEENDCGIASSFQGGCANQQCLTEERMYGFIELVCVTVIYIPLMLCGLIGNILTILVVVLRPYMRSSTYLYLSSMAVSDLLILSLLPLDLYKLWRPRPWALGDLACKLTMFLSECCAFCTILHITFLSLERYLAVCWPISAKTLVTRRRTRTVIGCLWLGAAVSAAPVLIMVGVEDIGGEEHGLRHWKEERGWRHREADERGLMMSGGERGSGHVGFLDGGMERIHRGGKEMKEWDEVFGGKEENGFGPDAATEKKQEDGGEKREEGGEEDSEMKAEEDSEMKAEGAQRNKKKEDEGGGREGGRDGVQAVEIDMRECRCTQYAASSGLLSAMMILSNLYFLIPLCILGLMYSLIGRTLCLRPKSSRRDQSHRHTNKMMGMIVLTFVLCWLPYYVGRTILSLPMGGSHDEQEPYTDLNPQFNVNPLSDDATSAFIRSDTSLSETSETFARIGKIPTETLSGGHEALTDIFSGTEVQMNTYTDRINTQRDVHSPHHKHTNSSTHTSHLEINTQAETRISSLPKDQIGSPGFINADDIPATNTYAATPADPHHNVTAFNDTYRQPDTHSDFLYYLSQYFNLVSSVLFYLSAAVNPLLYNLMSSRYRHAVHSLVHPHAHRQRHRLRTISTQYSTTML